MWGGVPEKFRECFEREHVGVEEGACFLVDGTLETLLSRGCCREIADSTSGDVILGERIHEPFANPGCVC